MKTKGLWIVLGIVGLSLLWGLRINNRLVTLNEATVGNWSQVQNQYQRRLDLVPNLVEVVKGYAKHEKETLESVISARSRASQMVISPEVLKDPKSFQLYEKAQGELTSALSRLMAVAENYPNLKANENFLQLQAQIEGTENRIAVERMRFNESVQTYNVTVRKFPETVVAGLRGFTPKTYFEAAPAAQTAPLVKF